jgi:hypothetical protein
MEPYPFHYTRR